MQDDIPVDGTGTLQGYVEEEALSGGNQDSDDVSGINGDGDGNNAVWSGSVSGLFSAGADQPGSYGIKDVPTGLPSLSSGGETVVYAVNGDVLTGYVESGDAGGLDGADRVVFTLEITDPSSGDFEFTLVDQIDHHAVADADDVETLLDLDLSGSVVGYDADGDQVGLDAGSLVITVQDDIPVDFDPEDAHVISEDGVINSAVYQLNFADHVGADKDGSVVFNITEGLVATDTSGDMLYLDGQALYLNYGETAGLEDRSILVATTNPDGTGDIGFTIEIDSSNDTYEITTHVGLISAVSMVIDDVDIRNEDIGGGNNTYLQIQNLGVPPDETEFDILVSSSSTSATPSVNTSQNYMAVDSQWIEDESNEIIRFDLVTNLLLDGGATASFSGGVPDYYTINTWKQDIDIQGNGTADLTITLRNADGDTDFIGDPGDTIVMLTALNSTIIVRDSDGNDVTGLVTITYNPDGSVTITDIDEDSGSNPQWSFEIQSEQDFSVIEIEAVAGSTDFRLGNFSISSGGTGLDPLDVSYDIIGQDEDGDSVGSSIQATIYPADSTIEGTSGDDVLVGTDDGDCIFGYEGNDSLSGGGGNDMLIGGAGTDELYGGADDDRLIYDPDDTVGDGGTGIDTLRIENGDDIDFDTLAPNPIDNIEIFDLAADTSGNSLANLDAADVLDMTDSNNELFILGDDADSVSGNGWTAQASQTIDGTLYNVYTGLIGPDTVTLYVQDNIINVTLAS